MPANERVGICTHGTSFYIHMLRYAHIKIKRKNHHKYFKVCKLFKYALFLLKPKAPAHLSDIMLLILRARVHTYKCTGSGNRHTPFSDYRYAAPPIQYTTHAHKHSRARWGRLSLHSLHSLSEYRTSARPNFFSDPPRLWCIIFPLSPINLILFFSSLTQIYIYSRIVETVAAVPPFFSSSSAERFEHQRNWRFRYNEKVNVYFCQFFPFIASVCWFGGRCDMCAGAGAALCCVERV